MDVSSPAFARRRYITAIPLCILRVDEPVKDVPTAPIAKMTDMATVLPERISDLWETSGASLADAAYLRLREEIIGVELPPGTLIREEDLTRRLGVGRTPVREAVQRLHRDGFVTIIPRRGTLVSEINITDLAGIYEVRTHLESWAARLAAERAGEGERAEAAALLSELGALTPGEGYPQLLVLDRRIHRFAYRCAQNSHLAETLDQYHNLSLRILNVALKRYPKLTPSLDAVVHDQSRLLKAIIDGDGPAAELAATEHVTRFEREIRKAI
jgi:DNA-binding GntR family transcriptional regulator